MSDRKLVVIGGDAAGMSAASQVRRSHPNREIIAFEKGNHTSYAACGMPYYIAGQIPTSDKLIARKPEVFREKYSIDARIRHEVTSIDTTQKHVTVTNLETGDEFNESYDDLLIATGATPIRPNLPGIESTGVFSLSTLQSGIKVYDFIADHDPKTAVMVGGGYIGIEMAEALVERGIQVTLIDMAPQVMTTMDEDMAELIVPVMRDAGVTVMLEEALEAIIADKNGRVSTVQTNNRSIEADLVILGIGVKPNTELARNAGIEIGDHGGISVSSKLETSVRNIWAAGDCASSLHRITGEQVSIALGTIANKHGVVAGTNISGGNLEFPGVLGTAITKFNELEIARTGVSEREAEKLGMQVRSASIKSRTKSGYYPGSGPITVKLVADVVSGRLLGGQIIGAPGSGKRIDTIAMAIMAEMSAFDLAYADLSYAPPFSPVWDPVQTAARQLLN